MLAKTFYNEELSKFFLRFSYETLKPNFVFRESGCSHQKHNLQDYWLQQYYSKRCNCYGNYAVIFSIFTTEHNLITEIQRINVTIIKQMGQHLYNKAVMR